MGTLKTCSIDGCEKPKKGRGWCAMHYARWQREGSLGPIEALPRAKEITPCTVDGCSELKRSSGALYCETHYYRVRRTGTVQGPQRYDNEICLVEGCSTPRKSNGMCDMHDTRIRRHGDPHKVLDLDERNLARGERSPMWTGDGATYRAVHQRLGRVRGNARAFRCVDCGSGARQWSYDHADPDQKISDDGPYSTDLSHYVPRCFSCHKRHDLAVIRAAGRAS